MKKRIKQILSAILVAVMLIGIMPITSFAEDGEKTFGYLKYEISDGEVTIKDCDAAVAGKIEIPASIDGYPVTKIYPGAFGNCANITEFYIPESINSIHNTSFEGCSGVNKIVVDSQNTVYDSREDCNAIIETKTNTLVRGCHTTVIPESVTAIGSFAFNNVTSLKSIDISDKITSIGKSAFYGCSSLGGIHIPDSVTAIGDTAFYGCSKLRFADIGDGLKYIGYLAFAYCSELNDLTIGSSVEKIENSAFKGCSNLERINIPDSVTSIGDESFALCSKLTDVIFGYGIEKLGWGTFNDTDLKYVFYDGSEDSWNQIEMYDNTKETLSNAKIHYNTKDHLWGEWVTAHEATKEATGVEKSTCSVCKLERTKSIPRKANTFSISLISESKTEAVVSFNLDEGEFNAVDAQIIVPDGLKISSSSRNENWKEHTLNSKHDAIYSINNTNGEISAITVDSYKIIGSIFLFTIQKNEAAPIDFSKFGLIVTSCTMNDSETVVPEAKVKVCSHKTTHVKTAAGCLTQGEDYDLCSLCGAKLNLRITAAGHTWSEWTIIKNATEDSDGLKKRVCKICGEEETYEYSTSLNSLMWEIEDDHAIIYGCNRNYIGELTIPSSIKGYPVTTVCGNYCESAGFEQCPNLTGIIFPENIEIYEVSFYGCNNLNKIVIPDNIKSISHLNLEGTAYYNDKSNWDGDVLYVGNNLITSKENISGAYTVRAGTILIGNAAFEYRNNLTEIIVPNSVKSIGEFAFLGCNNLSKIRLPDTGNLCLDKNTFVGTKYYNDSSNWENNVLYIGNHLIAANGELKGSCKVKDGTKTIANQAFSELFDSDIELTNIIFPETLERIGDSSFWGCNLEEVVIPNSVTYLGESAFWNNSYLKKVKISNNLNFVAAFGACDSLEEFAIPDGIEKIGSSGFVWCENLKTVTIPKSVTSIESKAFLGCKSLKDVYYSGSKEDWDKIVVEAENEPLLNATIHFNVSVHTHTLNHVTVPSTCKVAGMEYDICTECGETLNEKTLPLAAHKWSDWTVVKEPTATTEGIEKRTCSVCGDSETRSIDKFNGIRDSETGVEIIYNDEYSDGTELKVEEKFSGKSFQLIDTAYGKTNTAIYDISTYKDGVKVQPNGEITVRVPLPKGFSANKVFVCYVDSTNGKVTKIPCEVKDGYVVFKTDHFSEYAVVEQLACVKSVSISDITLNYKKSATIKPTIKADDGAKYTVKYSSSNTKVATVDKNGKVYGAKKGTATITCTVTDSNGNTVQDTCKVTVKYSFGQWLIVILLFGWIWY